jgi:hypothetical protein
MKKVFIIFNVVCGVKMKRNVEKMYYNNKKTTRDVCLEKGIERNLFLRNKR